MSVRTYQRMSCGNCGRQNFAVYLRVDGSGDPHSIKVRCDICGSVTKVSPRVLLRLEHDDDNGDTGGVLCVMPDETECLL